MLRPAMRIITVCSILIGVLATRADEPKKEAPRLIGHRGLIRHAPENTLAGFAACIELQVGFELDVRRSQDGRLVCVHDDTVKRTTNGGGKVAELSLAELKKLDAGSRFDPVFSGERVPTLDEVFKLLHDRKSGKVLVAIDFKIDDGKVEAEVVQLAIKHDVLDRLVCIGTAIESPAVRRRLREADARTPVAVLAKTADDLTTLTSDRDADWIYVRFAPTPEQMARIHQAGKRVLLSGPKFMGNDPESWRLALEIGADAMLTDYPLECRQVWRTPNK